MPNRKLFYKWHRWIERIRRELVELIVQQRHFDELVEATAPFKGTETGAEIGRWMAQGYYVYVCMGIRRLTESPKRNPPGQGDPRLSVSLVVLLDDLAAHHTELTRERLRKMYQRRMRHATWLNPADVADRAFDSIARSKRGNVISNSRIKRDIFAMRKVAKGIIHLTHKVYAHTERDRRRIGRPVRSLEIASAIRILIEVFQHYALLIEGRSDNLVPDNDSLSIMPDLKKVWPASRWPGEDHGDETEFPS
ncbi:MAG: hypothetical protein K2R98_09065 [Gemmataceae bacterium]|nr:hypothetical protein [Gemmataceae bacterium]